MIRKKIVLSLILMFAATALFGFGNKEVPEIPPVTTGPQYLSPNGDEIQDEAELQFTVKVIIKSKEGYIPEYGLRIIAEDGTVVAERKKSEKSDLNFFEQIFRGYETFTLEKSLTWDGRDSEGKIVPDGTYQVKLWVTDAEDQVTEMDVESFIVDTEPPAITLQPPANLIFSPNGDGKRDVLIILQEDPSEEAEWTGQLVKQENGTESPVREYVWKQDLQDLLWDGSRDDGTPAPQGVYSYSLTGTDLAGNTSDPYTVQGITLDNKNPALALGTENPYLSPNGDGIQDQVIYYPEYRQSGSIISWEWTLKGTERIFLRASGKPAEEGLPQQIALDGIYDEGKTLPPGHYTLSLSVEYDNGWESLAESPLFIDTAAPQIILEPDGGPLFSPNDDGLRDSVSIGFRSSEPVTWTGTIIDLENRTIREIETPQSQPRLRWDGTDSKGEPVPDGEYLLLGVFRDRGGNITYAEPLTLGVDRRPVSVELQHPEGFSPNGDGREDLMPLAIQADLYEDVASWEMTVYNESGKKMKIFIGEETLPQEVFWDGVTALGDASAPALEGRYTAELEVRYRKGDRVETASEPFELDVTPPELDLAVKADPFAETDEGLEGAVFLSVEAREGDRIDHWTLNVKDNRGRTVRTYTGRGDPSGDISWNNKENGGGPLPASDRFTIELQVVDRSGNRAAMTESINLDILLVKRNGKYYLTVPNIIFGAYQHELDSAGPAMEKQNRESLDRVADIAKRYPQYGLVLEGHALNVFLGGSGEEREERVLEPLTERRAATVYDALVERGVPQEALETRAFGGQHPLVSVRDRSVRWKNRRVEFVVRLEETE